MLYNVVKINKQGENEMTEKQLQELAAKIYEAAYKNENDLSDTSHFDTKVVEIYEWLYDGEEVTTETVDQLAADWIEYDQDEEVCEN